MNQDLNQSFASLSISDEENYLQEEYPRNPHLVRDINAECLTPYEPAFGFFDDEVDADDDDDEERKIPEQQQLASSPNQVEVPKQRYLKLLTQESIPTDQPDEILSSKPDVLSLEENKENNQENITRNRFAVRRKRVEDCIVAELKKIKTEANPPSDDQKIKIDLRVPVYRKYPAELKKKVVNVSKHIGATRASLETGIPETSIRRWSRYGIQNSSNSGRKPQYPRVETELFKVFRALRAKGVQITNNLLLGEARKIANAQNIEDFPGTQSWLDGFKTRSRIGYRKATHIGQKLKPDSKEKLKAFQAKIAELCNLHNYPAEAIVNADESGIFFDCPSNFTLELKGTKEIQITTAGAQRQRITCLLGVTASNVQLPLYIIFRAKKVPKDVVHLEGNDLKFTANSTAWMNQDAFCLWLDTVWKPYSEKFKRTLLILDEFTAHKTPKVLLELEKCRTDIVLIPPGLTFFCQPVDVYVNKPVKERVRKHWQEFIAAQQAENPGKLKKASRETVVNWVQQSFMGLVFEENVFFRVIMRNPNDLDKIKTKNEESKNDDNELIFEDEYEFITLE